VPIVAQFYFYSNDIVTARKKAKIRAMPSQVFSKSEKNKKNCNLQGMDDLMKGVTIF